MPTLFELNHVHVSINSTDILRDVSFEIQTGEFLGIIGPNGSGKSTLIRTMAGILKPGIGSVNLDGLEVTRISGRELARKLSVVPQDNSVAFDYTVLEVVLMGRFPHLSRFGLETSQDLQIATNALKRTGLLHLARRHISELSGGERQRVMIARTLAQETETIFLDEPTAHLDINHQVEILHLLKRENRDHGKTIIVVLHDLNLAAEFCDWLIMLGDGSILASGKAEDVITPENVRNAYGTSVWVRKHPTSGRPYILSLGSRAIASKLSTQSENASKYTVHVICGGGSGAGLFTGLLEMGCEVTAGVINIGDTDQEAVESLGIEYVEDAPFSPISKAAEQANFDFIKKADIVIVGDVPFGSGNLANLRGAILAIENEKPLGIIGNPSAYEERDFLGGEVETVLSDLIKRGAKTLSSDDVCDWVAKCRGE